MRGPCDDPSLPSAASAAARLPRVLLVEDNATNRLLMRLTLERAGVAPEVAEDGAAAVALACDAARRYDAILMDLQMPLMDGLEATRRIRASGGPNAGTRILGLTAATEAGLEAECLAAGMDGCLTKPVPREALIAALLGPPPGRTRLGEAGPASSGVLGGAATRADR